MTTITFEVDKVKSESANLLKNLSDDQIIQVIDYGCEVFRLIEDRMASINDKHKEDFKNEFNELQQNINERLEKLQTTVSEKISDTDASNRLNEISMKFDNYNDKIPLIVKNQFHDAMANLDNRNDYRVMISELSSKISNITNMLPLVIKNSVSDTFEKISNEHNRDERDSLIVTRQLLDIQTEIRNNNPSKILEYLQNNLKPVEKSVKSTTRGVDGENKVKDILSICFDVKDNHKVGKSGDFVINDKVLVEVKDYTRPVPKSEIDKFKRDLEVTNLPAGVFISLSSNVSNKRSFEKELLFINGRQIPVAYIHTDEALPMQLVVELMLAELDDSSVVYQDNSNNIRENILEMIEELSDYIDTITRIHKEANEAKFKIQKQLDTVVDSLKDFEGEIRRKVNNIRRELDSLKADKLEIVSDGIIDQLNHFKIDQHKNLVVDVVGMISDAHHWKINKTRHKMEHPKGIVLSFPKNKPVFSIDAKKLTADIIGDIVLTYVGDINIDSHVNLNINEKTIDAIRRLLNKK